MNHAWLKSNMVRRFWSHDHGHLRPIHNKCAIINTTSALPQRCYNLAYCLARGYFATQTQFCQRTKGKQGSTTRALLAAVIRGSYLVPSRSRSPDVVSITASIQHEMSLYLVHQHYLHTVLEATVTAFARIYQSSF